MLVYQPVRSERLIDLENLDRIHHENPQPVTPAVVDNNIDYLRREPSKPKPL